MLGNRVKVPFGERYRASRQIFGQSMRLLAKERDLWVFPLWSLVALLLGLASMAGTMWLLFGSMDGLMGYTQAHGAMSYLWFLLFMPVMYPFGVVMSVLQSALAFCLHERMSRRKGTKREGLRRAWSMVGTIARFNLVAMLVAGLLAVVGMVLDKLRIVPYLGRVLQVVGGLAWAAATFFVIPVLVLERERSAVEAIRSSVGLARSQWGKAVAGMVTIALAVMVPMMLAMFVLMSLTFAVFTVVLFQGGSMPSTWVLWMPLVVILPVVLLASALTQAGQTAYQVALYRYARKGKVAKPFTKETLVDVWEPYRQA